MAGLGVLIDSFRSLIGADPFLFWLFLGGIIVGSLTDLKRREVDNWLNLFMLVSGLVYVFYGAVLTEDFGIIFLASFVLTIMFIIMNLFYYGRVFAGGDAKLLFAMTAFFIGLTFVESMINIGIFLLFLMIGGSVYGLIYSGFLWFRNRDKVNGEIKKLIFESRWLFVIEGVAIILILFGFIHFLYPHIFFYFGWDMPFLLIGVLLGVFPFLFVFAKGLENVSMIREVSGLELREGDWLAEDTKVMVRVAAGSGQRAAETRVIKANWDGLSLEDIKILKGKRKVMIKEGLPFVPAFLIAFLGYVFLKDWFIGFLFGFS